VELIGKLEKPAQFFLGIDPPSELAKATISDVNHFVDVNKMVPYGMFRYLTSGFGFADNSGKIAPFRIAEKMLQITGEPEFNFIIGLLGVSFKGGGQCVDHLSFHLLSFRSSY
jgi:hypothetical protein